MNCENNFCIYQRNGNCILNEISIDSSGMCTECIYPDIDEEILKDAKLKVLKSFEESDKN